MKKIFLGVLSVVNLIIAIVIYALIANEVQTIKILNCIEILVGLLFIEFPIVLLVLNIKEKKE